MENGMYAVLHDIAIIEVLLVSGIAFIGAVIHEYTMSIDVYKRVTLKSWVNIAMSVVVSTILSLAINPFFFSNWPRLALLVPFFLGLLGTQLVTKFLTIHESFGFIEYLIRLFRSIKNGEPLVTPSDSKDLGVVDENDPDEILKKAISLKLQVRKAIEAYKLDKNDCDFVSFYDNTKSDIRIYHKKLEELDNDSINNDPIIKTELKELAEEEHLMDVLYHGLMIKNYR